MPPLSLICATKNRPDHVARRIPLWCKCGIDEVLIIDATYDLSTASRIEALCREQGARYYRFPVSTRDTRSRDRNRGAALAKGEWVPFQDDDEDIIVEFDHGVFDLATLGADYIWNGRGNSLVYHRRENFLRLGGYPEDMVNSEDVVFSWLVHATSRGQLEGSLYRQAEPAREGWERRRDVLRRTTNFFWYAFTILRYLERSPPNQRTNVIVGATIVPARIARGNSPSLGLVWVLTYSFGFVLGFAWHFVRKITDRKFRESLRFYRRALLNQGRGA